MKLLCFECENGVRTGVLDGTEVVDIVAALAEQNVPDSVRSMYSDPLSLIQLGDQGLEVAQIALNSGKGRHSLGKVRVLAPLQPRLIVCSGENYWDHRDEKPAVEGKEPEFFLKSPLGVIGPDESIVLDHRVTNKLDYEAELLIVIGKAGRHIPVEHALEHVFGYTIMNDVTARDRQVRLRPDGSSVYALGPGKNFDTSAPIGPVIVTRDEIADPQNLAISTRVNGELRQENCTRRMIWTVADLVAFFSTFITLTPGVVISTGTPGGTGWGSDPELGGRGAVAGAAGTQHYLKEGDVVVCEIEHIGSLRNRVVGTAKRTTGCRADAAEMILNK